MEKKTFKIELADGTQLENVTINGNCYIFRGSIGDEVLSDDNLTDVTIGDEKHTNMVCTNKWTEGDDTWFIIRDKSQQELDRMALEAKVDFLMAMQGVE